MKEFLKEWAIPIVVAIAVVTGYLYFNNAGFSHMVNRSIESPPYLSFKNNSLYIDEFKFNVGVTGENLVSGDFDNLNEKAYELLKGKFGKCEVFLKVTSNDKYGTSTGGYQSFGSLDLDELNKYQSVEYWKQSGGLQPILTGTQSATDSAVVENRSVLAALKNIPTDKPVKSTNRKAVFHFDGMTYKPWLYFKVEEDKLTELTANDGRITDAMQYWDEFISDIKDINTTCTNEQATVTITTEKGDSEFKLSRTYPDTYSLQGNPSIALKVLSPNECELYFMSEDNAVSVSNKSVEP